MWVCMYLFESLFPILWGTYLEKELLGHVMYQFVRATVMKCQTWGAWNSRNVSDLEAGGDPGRMRRT